VLKQTNGLISVETSAIVLIDEWRGACVFVFGFEWGWFTWQAARLCFCVLFCWLVFVFVFCRLGSCGQWGVGVFVHICCLCVCCACLWLFSYGFSAVLAFNGSFFCFGFAVFTAICSAVSVLLLLLVLGRV